MTWICCMACLQKRATYDVLSAIFQSNVGVIHEMRASKVLRNIMLHIFILSECCVGTLLVCLVLGTSARAYTTRPPGAYCTTVVRQSRYGAVALHVQPAYHVACPASKMWPCSSHDLAPALMWGAIGRRKVRRCLEAVVE